MLPGQLCHNVGVPYMVKGAWLVLCASIYDRYPGIREADELRFVEVYGR